MAIYPSIYNGPGKNYSTTSAKKKYIAIHNTSNDATAEAEASYAKRREDSVSSHYYVDNNSIVQSLDTKLKAWHAGSSAGNTYAIAYEITGTNSKSRDWWIKNVAWDLLGKQIATDMQLWGIANDHLTVSEIKAGAKTGIITHDDMRKAWGGTTHTDPGGNFPMDHLINKVAVYLGGPGGSSPIGGDELSGYGFDTPEQADNVHWRSGKIREDLATLTAMVAELAGKDFVNEQEIVTNILASLTPAAIAAAIPAGIAQEVADELSSRLQS